MEGVKKTTITISMKKLITLFLFLAPLFSFSQILINPTSTINTTRYNTAVGGSVAVSGTDTYVLNYLNTGDPVTGITTYTGFALNVTFTNANTAGPYTFNLNGLGAKVIKKYASGVLSDLVAGDIGPGERKRIYYNGTFIVMEGSSAAAGGGGTVTSVSGTANQIASTGGTDPVLSIVTNPILPGAPTIVSPGNSTQNIITTDATQTLSNKTLVAPALGTPASGVATNLTGTAAGLTAGTVTTNANLTGDVTSTGNATAIASGVIVNADVNASAAIAGSKLDMSSATGLPISTGVSGLGTGVATWLGTPSWTNFNSAITGTAPFWPLNGSASLTGAVTIIGTGNALKYQYLSLGTTQTDGYGLWLQNTTVASSGNQQISPSITWEGQGWKTQATAASQGVSFAADVLPVQGVGAPTGMWRLTPKINGVATSAYFRLNSDGARVDVKTAGLQVITNGGGVGGISLNGSDPSSNKIIMTPGSFEITTAGAWSAAGTGILLSPGSSVNATSGTQTGVAFTGAFIPTSGTANFNTWGFTSSINQTGGASGQFSALSIKPTYTLAPNVIAIDYDPTVTSSASHVFLRSTSGNILFGGTTITASTRVDQRGLGTTSSTINHRWANSSNTVLAQLTDDGALALNSKIVGRAVLVGGTVTVNTTAIQSGDEVFLTNRITGGTPGLLSVGTVTAGTSFVINSASALDTSTISWMIIKTAP